MEDSNAPIKVGVIADQTGPLSFMGIANANVATMVIEDMNATGGLLGRPIEMLLEDSATDDADAATKAEQLDRTSEKTTAFVDVVDHHLGEVDVGDAHEGERAGLIRDQTDPRRTVESRAHRRLMPRTSRAAARPAACRRGRLP